MAKKNNPNHVMTGIRYNLGNGGPIRLVPIGDIHVGDRHADLKMVEAMIEKIRADSDCYAVLCGDLMNTAIQGGKSDIYHEEMPPEDQIDTCAELLDPIKDRILAITPGNHEERISKQAGADTTRRLASELGLKSVYRPEAALVYIRTGKSRHGSHIVYSLYINHGHGGGGRRAGSKFNSLQDLGYVIDADIIIAGHTHMPGTFRTSQIRCIPQTGTADIHEQVFVNTASSLRYGGYGMRGGYQPPSNRYPIIELSGTEKDIKVTL